jgi:homopolymeric O-antigen transport system permease protein
MSMTASAVQDSAPTLIRAGQRRLRIRPAEFWAYRELLYFLVWRDAKVRYKQTVLGAAWAVLQPLLTMVVFAVFFGRLAHVPSDGRPYPLFTFAALVPWTYFATALANGANSLVGSQNLISKVYFPRLLIPVASVTTPLIDFSIALGLLLVALCWYGVLPSATIMLLPAFVLLGVLTALAAGLWLSVLNVEYRDVRYILPFAIQFWMFLTPVAYPASLVPHPWRSLYGLNPMATVVEGFRWTLLGTAPPTSMALASCLAVLVALVTGLAYFRRLEGTLADVI